MHILTAFAAFLFVMFPLQSRAQTPFDVTLAPPDSVAFVKETCGNVAECQMKSLLPVTLRTGNFAQCATSSLDNYKVDTGTPAGIYLFYAVKNGCPSTVVAKAKIGSKWYSAGTLSPGRSAFYSILFSAAPAVEPTVVMFCPPGSNDVPKDDQNC